MLNKKRNGFTILVVVALLMSVLTACGTKETDISDKIFLGSSAYFETQEVAEALLTAKSIPYTVVNAGTTSSANLAEVNAEYLIVKNGQSGYYVNKDESVVLKVFTYAEPESKTEQVSTVSEQPETISSSDVPETSNAGDASESDSVFTPKDVSDETIESIQTYADYLEMYRKIIDDYLANYEAVVKGTILYSEETFTAMKQQYDEAFDSQKTMYESFGNTKLVGKDTLVEFLISYRDSLKENTDNIADLAKTVSK